MARHLDLPALRALVAVSDLGGVTRAAGQLHLTQSAVSMQIKRLEDSLGLTLLDRGGRGVRLTPSGEQALSYARKILALNDEALTRFAARDEEGEIVLGVASDLVYPTIPPVLRRFARDYPRMKVKLVTDYTRHLHRAFAAGEADLILTTEDRDGPGAETLAVRPLNWIGAPGGLAWRDRPLRLAFTRDCIFRTGVQRRLDEVGIPWVMAVDSGIYRTIEATVSADFAIHVMMEGAEPYPFEVIDHQGELPDLWSVHVNLYARDHAASPSQATLVRLLREEHLGPALSRARPMQAMLADSRS